MDTPPNKELRAGIKDLKGDQAQAIFFETQAILETANFLKVENNPVARQTNKRSLTYGLEQYSLLPLHIIDMLELAQKAAARTGWQPVVTELERNIGQEYGSETSGISHYKILAQALRDEFDIDTRNIVPHPATDEFIRSIKELLHNHSPHFCLGMAYALESSAVPELTVVLSFVKKLAGNRPLQERTKSFFDIHLTTWEPSHENELRQAVSPYLNDEGAAHAFREGFAVTIESMRKWWDGLAEEAREVGTDSSIDRP